MYSVLWETGPMPASISLAIEIVIPADVTGMMWHLGRSDVAGGSKQHSSKTTDVGGSRSSSNGSHNKLLLIILQGLSEGHRRKRSGSGSVNQMGESGVTAHPC